MISFLSFPRGGGGGDRVTPTVVFPIQANRFAAFDAEIARNDRWEHESESDTLSVGARHQEGPRQKRRLVLMSSGTLATATDSLDSHDERFQRVRQAMERRPVEAVPAANQHGHSASEDHSEARVEGHVDATEPFGTAALRAAFATLDSIILPDLLKKRPSVMRSVLHFFKGPFRNALRLALDPSRAGLEIDVVAPMRVVTPSTTGRFDFQGQDAPEVPIICQRRVVDVVGGQRSL